MSLITRISFKRKGFTLIELLIVIGILAILATTITLVLNPAEILKQSRDSKRISDLRTLRGAIDLYLVRNNSSQTSLNGVVCVSGGVTYPTWRISIPSGTSILPSPNAGQGIQPFTSSGSVNGFQTPIQSVNEKAIDNSGWVSINFNETQGGSSIAKLPIDPLNVFNGISGTLFTQLSTPNPTAPTTPGSYFYAYQCQGLTYEINANMESAKYSYQGSSDVESTDGGISARACVNTTCTLSGHFLVGVTPSFYIYEIGNKPGLDL